MKVGQNIGLVRNVLSCEGNIHIVLEYFQFIADFFDYPLKSEKLGIHRVSDLGGQLCTVTLSEIHSKCVLLPFRDLYVVIPLTLKNV